MLSTKATDILRLLMLNDKKPVTAKNMAAELGMSERSIYNYIKEVEDFCRKNHISYTSKRGLGIFLDLNSEARVQINSVFEMPLAMENPEYRFHYIADTLLKGEECYSVSMYAEELYVSRSVILQDIEKVDQWLERYHLKTVTNGRKGVCIEGTETWKRSAIAGLSMSKKLVSGQTVRSNMDYRLRSEEAERMVQLYGADLFDKVCGAIREFERKFSVEMTDYSFHMLAEYVCIQLNRIKEKKQIEKAELSIYDPVTLCSPKAAELRKLIENYTGIYLPETEEKYLCMLMWAVEFQTETELMLPDQTSLQNTAEEMKEWLIGFFYETTGLELGHDQVLETNLERFLIHSLVRTRYGLEIRNIFFDEIKKTYSSVFTTCYSLAYLYKEYAGCVPEGNEIAFLTLIIGGAMIRVEKKADAVFVGGGGLFTARLTAEKIERGVPGIHIAAILSTGDLCRISALQCDMIITTLTDFQHKMPVVSVSPLINERDLMKIKRGLNGLFTKRKVEKQPCKLTNYIRKALITLDVEPGSREELIRLACKPLEERGYVSENYCKEVLHREKTCSTDIGNGVAIPHGVESHVYVPSVVLIRLKHDIAWGESRVDLIFLLALNFDEITQTRKFFHLFYDKIGDGEIVDRIRRAENEEQIIEILEEP